MKVDSISASIKFSKDTSQGWKTIEVSAEGSVSEDEDWLLSRQALYTQLAAQLKQLWQQNGVGQEHAPDGPTKPVAGSSDWEMVENLPTPNKPREHWCSEHNTEFRKYEKDGRYWYSPSIKDGGWCKEQPVLRGWRNG
jgi:hypothetical protein